MSWLTDFFGKYALYIFLALFLFDIILAVWVFILRKNFRKIFGGSSAGGVDLEKVLLELRENQNISATNFEELKKRIKVLEEAMPKNISRIGLVRYNPFSDAGGDQSFVLALLNDKNDGVVLSSLYGREINKMYAKPILGGKSQYQLTAEEIKAIENAK